MFEIFTTSNLTSGSQEWWTSLSGVESSRTTVTAAGAVSMTAGGGVPVATPTAALLPVREKWARWLSSVASSAGLPAVVAPVADVELEVKRKGLILEAKFEAGDLKQDFTADLAADTFTMGSRDAVSDLDWGAFLSWDRWWAFVFEEIAKPTS